MPTTTAIPGYDTANVESWIATNVPRLKTPLTWTRLEGGHSNLTYLIQDQAGAKAVIRRPPLGELLPKAHDMAREWTLIKALEHTRVPVPAAYGFCDDTSITGARFYVMGFVDGRPLYNAHDTERYVPESSRTDLSCALIDVLAELHALDPNAIGLGELGKPENYVGRQINTWYRSWLASAAPASYDDPRAHALQKLLAANIPEQGPARVVHGDFGFHNSLIGEGGTVKAIVDWEISTLGDPLADLAYVLNQFPDPALKVPPRSEAATSVPGFPDRKELAERYAKKTGRNLEKLDFYIGFNRWKTACIIHGVYARYMEGKKSTEGVGLEELRLSIERSLDAAEIALARWK
jgi:aminoglycoside phosphotransferase (APT) family kinase protein